MSTQPHERLLYWTYYLEYLALQMIINIVALIVRYAYSSLRLCLAGGVVGIQKRFKQETRTIQ